MINRPLGERYAFGVYAKQEFSDADAVISKGSRLLFVVPWRGVSLVGTAHKPYHGDAEDYRVTESDIEEFLQQVNSAMPDAGISRKDVSFFYGGLLPMTGLSKSGDVQIAKHFRIVDHEKQDGLPGLLTVQSVKYTTARDVAERAVNAALVKLNRRPGTPASRSERIWGGDIDDFTAFRSEAASRTNGLFPAGAIEHLTGTFGSEYGRIVDRVRKTKLLGEPVDAAENVLMAEIDYAIEEEMACHLSDVIMRRTELGSAGRPSTAAIHKCADYMAHRLSWTDKKRQQEIGLLEDLYRAADA